MLTFSIQKNQTCQIKTKYSKSLENTKQNTRFIAQKEAKGVFTDPYC